MRLFRNPKTGYFTDYETLTNDVYTMRTHSDNNCATEYCDIHGRPHPNDPLKDAPLNWRTDAEKMERICEHGIGHTTYAQLKFWESIYWDFDSHACDGCCYFDDKLPGGGEEDNTTNSDS